MSLASYAPVATVPAHTARAMRPAKMSRGRQLEAAVENLSAWYFEYDEPKSGWHTERIHPLPEECSTGEQPQDNEVPTAIDVTSTTTTPITTSYVTKMAMHVEPTSNQDDDDEQSNDAEAKPPVLVPHKSDEIETKQQPRSRDDHRSSTSTRGTTSSTTNDLAVSGWTIRGSEKKVMYHIDVRGFESQLQTYTIRRSYTDFKHLHSQLSDILEARREHYQRTKAVAALAMATRHSMPHGRTSLDTATATTTTRYSSNNHRTSLEFDAVPTMATPNATAEDLRESWFLAFTLPPLPNAGFLSYWKRHDRTHLQNRCEMFQEILRAANQHPDLRESYAMQVFLKFAPCAIRERGSSYVSLCEYSVPRLDLEEEKTERKKLARERRRNSSAHPMSTPE